jgi:hypothetical protein
MSGVKGRSGRPRKPVAEHLLKGTYRADRHGPRPGAGGAASDSPMPIPRIPPALLEGLGPDGRAFVAGAWADFSGPRGAWSGPDQALLRLAAEAHDTLAACRTAIARDGLMLTGRTGRQYASPWLRVQQATTRALLAIQKQLGLGR